MAKPNQVPENTVINPPRTEGNRRFSIVLKSAQEGINAPFDLGNDISDDNRRVLAKHLSNVTKEAKNTFPIPEGSTLEFTRDNDGNQLPLVPDNKNGQKSYLQTFRDAGVGGAIENFQKTSKSGMLDTDTQFDLRIHGTDTAPFSGDELLRDVDKNLQNSNFSKRVVRVLGQNAVNSPANKFIEDNIKGDDSIAMPIPSNKSFGSHSPAKFPASKQQKPSEIWTIQELKKVGLVNMLQATGEVISPNIIGTDVPVDITAKLSTVTPGLARSGFKIPVSRFTINAAAREVKPDFDRDPESNIVDGNELYSYGSVNSPFVPFAGPGAAPSIANATLLVTVVAGLLKSFKLFEVIGKKVDGSAPKVFDNRKKDRSDYLGSFRGTANQRTFKTIDIVDTDHDFYECLDKGMSVFFNTDTPSQRLALGNASSNVAKIHGYYNTVLRNVVRSLYELTSLNGTLTSAIGGDTVNPGTLISAADPTAVIEKLNSSSALKFVNMLLTIGDKTLNILDQRPNGANSFNELLGELNSDTFITDIDAIADTIRVRYGEENIEVNNPAILQSKGRLSNGQAAIGNSTVRSLLLMPNTILGTARAFNRESQLAQTAASLKKNNFLVTEASKMEQSKNRIKPEIVEQVETHLEADYVPFYFHDLRTNEILSFHAFLSNVAESFDVEYEENGGYGRIGEVNIYKNTKRSLNLQFSVLATSDEDFDEMWYKINKMAVMCYPQWTQGRVISYGGNKFVQPFSQLPGAAPLVRLRIGDLIKGNYSKLNVARLFGLSGDIGPGENSTFNLSTMEQTSQDSTAAVANAQRLIDQINGIVTRQQARVYEVGDIVKIRGNVGGSSYPRVVSATGTAQGLGSGNSSGVSSNINLDRRTGLQSVTDIKGRVVRVEGDGTVIVSNVTMMNDQPVANRGNRTQLTTVAANDQFLIPVGSLVPTAELAQRQVNNNSSNTGVSEENRETDAQSNSLNSQAIQRFFDDSPNSSNPIMRAFSSTKGKGLAGVIKNMSLDYESAPWVTFRHNSRAPMLVKISITYSPTHDIQPGLDSNGFMTAPIWNVGDYMKNISNTKDELAKQMASLQNAASALRLSSQR